MISKKILLTTMAGLLLVLNTMHVHASQTVGEMATAGFKTTANFVSYVSGAYFVFSALGALTRTIQLKMTNDLDEQEELRDKRYDHVVEGSASLGVTVVSKVLAEADFKKMFSALIINFDVVHALELLFNTRRTR